MTVFHPTMILELGGLAAVLTLFALCYDPQRLHGRLLRRSVAGFVLLLGWNAVSGIQLGINPLSLLTAGALGAPGVGLLCVMAMLP